MTLLSALRASGALALATALVTSGMTAAHAGDWPHQRSYDNHRGLKTISRHHHDASRGGVSARLRHERVRGRRAGPDTYTGGILAYRDGGSGLYFYVEDDGGYRWTALPEERRASGPKIITVTPGANGCSWEHGVCVIRPGQ